jgi:hypothetical protein
MLESLMHVGNALLLLKSYLTDRIHKDVRSIMAQFEVKMV